MINYIDKKYITYLESRFKRDPIETITVIKTKVRSLERLAVNFENLPIYVRFLRLAKLCDSDGKTLQIALLNLRKTQPNGLPQEIFENPKSGRLCDRDGKLEMGCSWDLFLSLYPRFKAISEYGTKEYREKKLSLPLSAQAFHAFKEYLYTGQFTLRSKEPLKEILVYAGVLDDSTLQELTFERLVDLYVDDPDLEFEPEFFRDNEREFVTLYLNKRGIEFTSSPFDCALCIPYLDFIKLFNRDQSKLLTFIAPHINNITIPEELVVLEDVPKIYRQRIQLINVKVEKLTRNQLMQFKSFYYQLSSYFPNADFALLAQGDIKDLFPAQRNNAFVYMLSGEILRQRGDFEGAIKHLREAVKLNPNDGLSRRSLVGMLKEEDHLRKAVELNPEHESSHGQLGRLLVEKGELVEAEKYIRKTIELNPLNGYGHAYFGALLLMKGHLVGAEEWLRKSVELSQQSENYFYLGEVLRLKGELDGAEKNLEKALELHSYHGQAHSRLGDLLRLKGNLKNAEMHLRKALDLDSKDVFTYTRLAALSRTKEDFEEAEKLIGKAETLIEEIESGINPLAKVMLKTLQIADFIHSEKDELSCAKSSRLLKLKREREEMPIEDTDLPKAKKLKKTGETS